MSRIPAPFVAAYFDDPHDWTKAVEASTNRGHIDHDGYMPYPVHGFDGSFGYRRSWIGRVVLFMLLFGAFCGYMMQFYMMKVDWPIIIGGKPYNSWPAYVVITFESGILLGALTNMVCVVFVACKLFPKTHTFVTRPELTDDVFSLCIPVAGNGSEEELCRFLREHGGRDITVFLPQENDVRQPDQAQAAGAQGAEHA